VVSAINRLKCGHQVFTVKMLGDLLDHS